MVFDTLKRINQSKNIFIALYKMNDVRTAMYKVHQCFYAGIDENNQRVLPLLGHHMIGGRVAVWDPALEGWAGGRDWLLREC